MASSIPPKTVNGSINSVFNSADYSHTADTKYDLKYLPLTGGVLTGGLTTNSLTVSNSISTNGFLSSSGVNEFDTNITLPTTYSSSPNNGLPSNAQLGGYLAVATTTPITAATGVVSAIVSLSFNAGVWLVTWRGSIFPSTSGTSTYSNIRMSFTTSSGTIDHTTDIQQRVSIASTQTCTFGATNGYDVSLMGCTIIRPTAVTTYYLNASSVFSGTPISQYRGHIYAVRIA